MTEDSAPPGFDGAQPTSPAPPDRASGGRAPVDGQQPSDAASGGPQGSGHEVPAVRSHARTRWLAGAIVAVLGLAGGAGIWYLATAHRAGNIVLPGALLGTSKYAGPGAQALERKIEDEEQAESGSNLTAPVAAVYGNPDGPGFLVLAGALCTGGGCVLGTPGQAVQAFRAKGYADARSFPPGPGGYIMVCFSKAVTGERVISCAWIGHASGVVVAFYGGYASGLADAAAMTRQIGAVIGH